MQNTTERKKTVSAEQWAQTAIHVVDSVINIFYYISAMRRSINVPSCSVNRCLLLVTTLIRRETWLGFPSCGIPSSYVRAWLRHSHPKLKNQAGTTDPLSFQSLWLIVNQSKTGVVLAGVLDRVLNGKRQFEKGWPDVEERVTGNTLRLRSQWDSSRLELSTTTPILFRFVLSQCNSNKWNQKATSPSSYEYRHLVFYY